ncbi:hypothetical protein NBRC10513_002623 [Rhodotorula toruloides]
MSTNLTAPTDEPFSCPSNRLSRSPDEDPGTARHAQNDARGLVATAPRSLSSLPTEILQNIFTQLHHLTRVPRLATKGFRIELRYTQLDKCIFGIAKPIWMSLFILPPDAIEPTGKLVQDPRHLACRGSEEVDQLAISPPRCCSLGRALGPIAT